MLEGEAKTKAAEQALATARRLEEKNAAIAAELAKPVAAPPAKPKMPQKVAAKVAITKPKITEGTKPEPTEPKPEPPRPVTSRVTPEVTEEPPTGEAAPPRKVWPMVNTTREGMHEGAREAHIELNKIKAWVNGLTDANYDRLPEFAHRQMQDTNDVEGVRRIAKAFEEEFGYNVLTEKVTAKHEVDVAQAAPVAPRAATVVSGRAKRALTEEQKQAIRDKMAGGPGLLRMSDTPAQKSRVVEFAPGDNDIWDSPLHKAKAMFGHDEGSIGYSGSTADVLRNLDMAHLEGEGWEVPKYIIDFTRRRLTELLGNTQIHFASADLMLDATGDAKAPYGYYHPPHQGRPGYIVVQAGLSPARTAHVVVHEALHAVLHSKINSNPTFRKSIEALMQRLSTESELSEFNKKLAKPALKDVHEFVSEALSNRRLQLLMQDITVTPEGGFGLKPQTLWTRFVGKVRSMMGLPAGAHNMLSETLRLVSPELESAQSDAVKKGEYQAYGGQLHRLSADEVLDKAAVAAKDAKINLGGSLATKKDFVSTLWQMARRGEQYFGPSNPLNRLFDLRAKMEKAKDVILKTYGGARATLAVARAERNNPEAMAKGKQIALDASLHDVNLDGSNDHLGKDKLMGVQPKNEIAALQKAWNDPALDPVRPALRQAMKFFKDIHNATSRATIKNILAEANIHDEALAERIHQSGLTEADRKTWGDSKLVSALDAVSALKHRHGSFIPFRRYGDYISAAEHELSVPANATKINDNTLQFLAPNHKNMSARAMVKDYLRSNSHTPQGNKLVPSQVRKVWVDKNNPSQLMEGTEPDAVPAYRVAMQTAHVEMHETPAAAENSMKDLKDAGLSNPRTHKREEAYRTDVTNIQSAMGTVLRSLEKQQRYIDADATQKAAMREMFHDLSLGLSGTTSIKNSMRQRRNVAGMSHDLGRVTADYARMTANHLAKLQYRPQIDAVFKEMRDYIKGRGDKDNIRREEVYNEFQERIYGKAASRAEEHKPGPLTRVLQLTRLSFLAGPSYHLINLHEVMTAAMPVIGGRHGFSATLREIAQTYNLIGGRGAIMSGLKDMAKAYTNDEGFTDYVKLFKETIGKSKIAGADKIRRNQDMIDYMDARNLYSNASIFEMAKYANAEGNIAGRALDRIDLMANQVGTAIEAINRTETGSGGL